MVLICTFFLPVFYPSPLSYTSSSVGQIGLSRNNYQTHNLCTSCYFLNVLVPWERKWPSAGLKVRLLGIFRTVYLLWVGLLPTRLYVDLYILLQYCVLYGFCPHPYVSDLVYDFCPTHSLRLRCAHLLFIL